MTARAFQPFQKPIAGIPIPEKFTFPFYYTPHPLSKIAAEELQEYLRIQNEFQHNFGLNPNEQGPAIGKMFGVLVCENSEGVLGYLWAFSGKLADANHHQRFVPPVFDMLTETGFFKLEEEVLNRYNREIEQLEHSAAYLQAFENKEKVTLEAEKDLEKQKKRIRKLKKERDFKRAEAYTALNQTDLVTLETQLSEESKKESILLKKMTKYWKFQIEAASKTLDAFRLQIKDLKEKRSEKSAALQQKLFDNYLFLNQKGILKSIGEIFDDNPPAGAGECAAPKLLHYAFKHELKPIAMAEFWWGESPKSEVRKHKQYYPACKSKCEPILMTHMLEDLKLEINPFHSNPAKDKELKIVYEDASIVIINKPAEFLSVPGKLLHDSVYTRVKALYPKATGPLIVHRLDMSTSGLLVIAKDEETYKSLQRQFIKRTVKKRYVALLDGILEQTEGLIDLPLRVDLDDRPRQLVCYEHGKNAQTRWEVLSTNNNQTRVYFYPITGRTHQLRVHAAHQLGLKTPIVGDDLYGNKAKRLYLHAESITFSHPQTGSLLTITEEAPF